jgi:hypothetical protein
MIRLLDSTRSDASVCKFDLFKCLLTYLLVYLCTYMFISDKAFIKHFLFDK